LDLAKDSESLFLYNK